MKQTRSTWAAATIVAVLQVSPLAHAQDGLPGVGNAAATKLASSSPLVRSAYAQLLHHAKQIGDDRLRQQTLDALGNPQTCIRHRENLTAANKAALLQELIDAGLLSSADAAAFSGGALAGVFPPVLQDGTRCPQLPQPFLSAPGSAFGGHHSFPGGLSVHEHLNELSDLNLASVYRQNYGHSGLSGLPEVATQPPSPRRSEVFLDQDVIVAAPLWHDWAKPIVFQWNADGSEFPEFNFGGNGATDNYGSAGDSRTGAHHILGVAETIKRGLPPELVIAQASAHSTPTSGTEYKVVNWLRAAALIAGVDPVAEGYLERDAAGQLRLPALRALGEVDLNAAGQTNFLVEFPLHNLSDADFSCSGPAVSVIQIVLKTLAAEYGYDASQAAPYNLKYRNVALSHLSAERLLLVYSHAGLAGVRAELNKLRARKLL